MRDLDLLAISSFELQNSSNQLQAHVAMFVKDDSNLLTSAIMQGTLVQTKSAYSYDCGNLTSLLASFDKTESSMEHLLNQLEDSLGIKYVLKSMND